MNSKVIKRLQKRNKPPCKESDYRYFAPLGEAENTNKIIVLFVAH